jgi:hypothetical protein
MKALKTKSKFRSAFLILSALALWVAVPFYLQMGASVSADATSNYPDLIAQLTGPQTSSNPSAASGIATYDVRTVSSTSTVRELTADFNVSSVPNGTSLKIFLNDTQIGAVSASMNHGHFAISTAMQNTTVPNVVSGDTFSVKNGTTILLSGQFAAPATPSPTTSPSHTPTPTHTPTGTPTNSPTPTHTPTVTPTPNGTPQPVIRFFAPLSGDAIDGVIPRGLGEYEARGTHAELDVFVNSINLPNGTILSVSIDGTAIGNITLQNHCGVLRRSNENGGTVPTITSGSTVTVKNGDTTVVSGVFSNTLPTPTGTPSGTPHPSPSVSPSPNHTPRPARAFRAKLLGNEVVPPVTTQGRGLGLVVLNEAETQITVHLGYFNLSSAVSTVTINGAAIPGENGSVIFTLTNPGGTSGRVETQTFDVTAEQVEQLRAGTWYFLVSTANNATGEIRGQIRGLNSRDDYDGDGRTDIGVIRTNDNFSPDAANSWYILNSYDQTVRVQTMGNAGDINVQGDYDGDGVSDLAMFTPSTGTWNIRRSATGSTASYQFGQNGDVPMVGDYDGDGRNDLVVFRPSNGVWYIARSTDGGYTIARWGVGGDKPVAGDFDGDGLNDLAVFRPSDGNWYIFRSSDQNFMAVHWGANGDKPIAGDFNGDGTTDLAVFRPSNGNWYLYQATDNSFSILHFGASGDVPVACEYDGDGQTDIAVFRPSDGNWYILRSSDNSIGIFRFGIGTDKPIQTVYAP